MKRGERNVKNRWFRRKEDGGGWRRMMEDEGGGRRMEEDGGGRKEGRKDLSIHFSNCNISIYLINPTD